MSCTDASDAIVCHQICTAIKRPLTSGIRSPLPIIDVHKAVRLQNGTLVFQCQPVECIVFAVDSAEDEDDYVVHENAMREPGEKRIR